MIQLRGKDQAKEILFEDFTAAEALQAQEQLRLRREEDQKKMKVTTCRPTVNALVR